MKNAIHILLVLFVLTSCSTSKNNSNVSENSPKDNTEDITDLSLAEEVFNEFSILVAADAINIRRDPSTTSKENIIDQVYMGETYTVYEQTEDSEYTWYRIGEDRWIANDGTWCIEYGDEENEAYPHVMNEEERIDFLSIFETGGWLWSGYLDSKDYYLYIFNDPNMYDGRFGCNILFIINITSMNDYRYNVSNIVKMDSNTYDMYVVPVKNNGFEDYSTGILRISNVGTYVGDGNPNDIRLCFNI